MRCLLLMLCLCNTLLIAHESRFLDASFHVLAIGPQDKPGMNLPVHSRSQLSIGGNKAMRLRLLDTSQQIDKAIRLINPGRKDRVDPKDYPSYAEMQQYLPKIISNLFDQVAQENRQKVFIDWIEKINSDEKALVVYMNTLLLLDVFEQEPTELLEKGLNRQMNAMAIKSSIVLGLGAMFAYAAGAFDASFLNLSQFFSFDGNNMIPAGLLNGHIDVVAVFATSIFAMRSGWRTKILPAILNNYAKFLGNTDKPQEADIIDITEIYNAFHGHLEEIYADLDAIHTDLSENKLEFQKVELRKQRALKLINTLTVGTGGVTMALKAASEVTTNLAATAPILELVSLILAAQFMVDVAGDIYSFREISQTVAHNEGLEERLLHRVTSLLSIHLAEITGVDQDTVAKGLWQWFDEKFPRPDTRHRVIKSWQKWQAQDSDGQ